MPPRRFKKKSVKRIVEKRVAKAIEEYEKTRTDSNNAGGSGSANTGGTVAPEMHGCSYKTFTNGKPHSFNGTEGVVGLKRWFEKMEQVFEICKCAEDDKRNVKAMMTTEYCPATEIQRMEQELWTMTLKGDDIEAYNNRFHELTLICPELVPTKKKKIENKTEDKKLLRFMWQPQLRVEATLGTYHGAIGARHIISQVRVLLGVVNVTSLVTRKGVSNQESVAGGNFTTKCDALVVGIMGTTGPVIAPELRTDN
ncbi:hypothetical protein Tco_1057198 [Tanacetum coccineum]|uniref:Retrotransposon gag domain-containing protein n=1 Tax=Tanacetum coccineum TaxID=301880 RepID=A0ABQ5H5N8_9ASTR